MSKKIHKDVEFAVDNAAGEEHIFKTFDEAAGFAVAISVATGRSSDLDVLVYSRAGARAWSGDTGVEQYDEDPEASVFERVEVRAQLQGRVP